MYIPHMYIYIYSCIYQPVAKKPSIRPAKPTRDAATSANDRDSHCDPTDRVYRFDAESRYISVARLSQAV